MNKNVLCLTTCCVLLFGTTSPTQADDSLNPPEATSFSEFFQLGTFKGLFRYSGQYRNSNLLVLQDDSNPNSEDVSVRQYSAAGGFAGYKTAPWGGFSLGATIYGAVPFGNNPASRRGLGGLNEDRGEQESYWALGEVFAEWAKPGHLVRVGKQEMPDYRYVSLSDIRMSPITHEGAVYEYRDKDGVSVNFGYITRMKERNAERFIDMARGARLKLEDSGKQLPRGDFNRDYYDDSGYIGPKQEMVMAGLLYAGERYNLEAWNYFITDFVNTLYLYGDVRLSPEDSRVKWTLAAQYSDQRDVGEHIAGNIDTWHWGLSLRAASGPWSAFANYNEVKYNEDSYDGGTIFVRWGTPQMFMSFQVQDSELAGTKSYGGGFQYDFGLNGRLRHFVMRWRYGIYDMPDDLLQADARQDRKEATFDLRWSQQMESGFGIFTRMKGWSTQFRLAYNNYETGYDFEAYREIHGYEFSTATKDFVDARLYVEFFY